METKKWYQLNNPEDVISPSLLVYPDRIEENIKAMIRMVGDVSRLRPHVKTHKTAEIIKMQLRHGIQKFKCATIAEAELLAQCSAKDILLAMQPVGANIKRLFTLIKAYPNSNFSTIADSMEAIQKRSALRGFEYGDEPYRNSPRACSALIQSHFSR